jgi:hypothetical protein
MFLKSFWLPALSGDVDRVNERVHSYVGVPLKRVDRV